MEFPILSAPEFYTRWEQYIKAVDPTWEEESYQENEPVEIQRLRAAIGEGHGRSVLDCSCGTGYQAIPLAKLGWRVTATDITRSALEAARSRAANMELAIDFQVCDMRDLGQLFDTGFDRVVTCMALDNICEEQGIQQAIQGMVSVLNPGGMLYLRLRDFDAIMTERPRYEFKWVRPLPYGRLYRMEDWVYESETHVVHIDVFWLEDDRKTGYPWSSEILAYRRRVLRKAVLEPLLLDGGFRSVEFLPRPEGFYPPYEVLAVK